MFLWLLIVFLIMVRLSMVNVVVGSKFLWIVMILLYVVIVVFVILVNSLMLRVVWIIWFMRL